VAEYPLYGSTRENVSQSEAYYMKSYYECRSILILLIKVDLASLTSINFRSDYRCA